MKFPKFTDITNLSFQDLLEQIEITQQNLFNLNFKKATRQSFKSHEIKFLKRRLAQLKTLKTSSLTIK